MLGIPQGSSRVPGNSGRVLLGAIELSGGRTEGALCSGGAVVTKDVASASGVGVRSLGIGSGEPWEASTNASRNVEEDDDHSRYSFVSEEIEMDDNDFGDFGSDPYEFANVIGDGDQPLYPGCRKYTKLSTLVKLYNLKAKHRMSDVCFTEGNTIPASMYEAKKTLCALGLSYEKMHACPNDCILHRKEYEDSTNCPTCGISRISRSKDSILKEGVPAKVVWYFPSIPRFKRMFQSHEIAKSLTWHAARKSIDGQMSPADSPSWKLL
ncbi:unnamed protein product, partial [Prunus brigantina]